MAHLSRPYQIALGALVLVALMWFLAFGHHSSSSGGSSASSSSTPPAQSGASASGGSVNGSSKIYHGSAPGVEGLSKDIARAHGAVSTSETYQQHLEEKSAKATAGGPGAETAAGVSGSAPAATVPAGSSAATAPAASAPAKAPAASATTKTAATRAHTAPARTHAATGTHVSSPAKPKTIHVVARTGTPSGQRAVEATVKSGKVALLLFWNPSGANDVAVRGQVNAVKGEHLPVVVYEASPADVASFGAITRQVPVYGTPTILLVAAKGHTSSLTGLQDAFSIRQAIEEARSAAS